MGSACSCSTDESTLNLGFMSCSLKHFGCMKSKDDNADEEHMNEIAKRVEERLREYMKAKEEVQTKK